MASSPVGGSVFGVILGVVFAISATGSNRSRETRPQADGDLPTAEIVELAQLEGLLVGGMRSLVAFATPGVDGGLEAVYQRFGEVAHQLRTAGVADNVQLMVVDVDAVPEASERFAVRSVPTVLTFRGDEEIGRWEGLEDAGVYAAALTAARNDGS